MREAPPLVRPRPIGPGATLGVCAPAGPICSDRLDAGIARLESRGYHVRLGEYVRGRHGYLAATDEERCRDLCSLLRDPAVAGIVPARGGYGLGRLLPALDPNELRRERKLVVGYSDLTSLHLFLRARCGLASVHGPMLERDDATCEAIARLDALWNGASRELDALAGDPLQSGLAMGPLVGGNLKTVVASLGTPWEIDTTGAILFFEEVNEQPYAIDRMLIQLREAGKLEAAVGAAVGRLVACESERYPDPSAHEVIVELLAPAMSGPIVTGLPFGHVADNRALGHGTRAELDGRSGTLALVEPVVEEAE